MENEDENQPTKSIIKVSRKINFDEENKSRSMNKDAISRF